MFNHCCLATAPFRIRPGLTQIWNERHSEPFVAAQLWPKFNWGQRSHGRAFSDLYFSSSGANADLIIFALYYFQSPKTPYLALRVHAPAETDAL